MSKNKSNKSKGISRRHFLRTMGGCAAMSQTAMLSTLMNLSLTKSAAAAIDTSGYKALVCIFLFGGIDSYNVLVPMTDSTGGTSPYDEYHSARGSVALDNTVTPLHPIIDPTDARGYGLHPQLPELKELYDGGTPGGSGNLAFVANVGSLIEPIVDPANYRNYRLPLGLYSHSDQQRHWQTSTPQSRTEITGWAGRMADILNDAFPTPPEIPMNLSLAGLNILQTGEGIAPYVVSTNGAILLSGYDPDTTNAANRILTDSTDSLLDQTYTNLLKQTHGRLRHQAIDAADGYNTATKDILPGTDDPVIGAAIAILNASSLGRQLKQVAKTIGAHGTLGQDRQVFFTSRGGFDNHSNLLPALANSLPDISQSMKAFYDVTAYLGVENDVVTFTASDFARTLSPNANAGSDHAWGGNHIVMGGGVNGGRLFGSYPDSLAPGNPLDTGSRGRLIPTTSVDQYMAELAMWFGIGNDATLETILPNIRNFLDAGAPPPLGFMDMPG